MDPAADLNLITPCCSYRGECQNYQKNCGGRACYMKKSIEEYTDEELEKSIKLHETEIEKDSAHVCS